MPAHESATPAKLVYMANQIGKFFTPQDRETAPARIATHLRRYWDPQMRKAILAYVDGGGGGLDPEARQAVEQLRAPPGSA